MLEKIEVHFQAEMDEAESKITALSSRMELAEKKAADSEKAMALAQRVIGKLVEHRHLPDGEVAVRLKDL